MVAVRIRGHDGIAGVHGSDDGSVATVALRCSSSAYQVTAARRAVRPLGP